MISIVKFTFPNLDFILEHISKNLLLPNRGKNKNICIVISDPFKNEFETKKILPDNFTKITKSTSKDTLLSFQQIVITELNVFEENLDIFLSYLSLVVFVGCQGITKNLLSHINLNACFYFDEKMLNFESSIENVDNSILLDVPVKSIIPTSLSFSFPHGQKAITSVALDTSGSRMFTGSVDSCVKMWDFHTLSRSSPQPFREISQQHLENYQIHTLLYGTLSDKLLVINDSCQARFFSKEGQSVGCCPRGDVYLKDLKNTRGHTVSLSGGDWHPTKSEICITSSKDGSVRFWNVDDLSKQKDLIIVKSSKSHKIQPITCCKFKSSLVLTASTDNIIRAFSLDKPFSRPSFEFQNGSSLDSEIGSLSICQSDENLLLTRSTDDSVRIWDLRNVNCPLKIHSDLPCKFAQSQAIFSPCGQFYLAGTHCRDGTGELNVFSTKTFETEMTIKTTEKIVNSSEKSSCQVVNGPGVVAINWHPKLNQIFLGLSNGSVLGLYDNIQSTKGIKLIKMDKKKYVTENIAFEDVGKVYLPFSLPLYDETETGQSAKGKILRDPKATKQPEAPLLGQGIGGKIGTNATAKVMQTLLGSKHDVNEDPREIILKYADAAEKEPFWSTPAYKNTQPSPIFQDDENRSEKKVKKEDGKE